MFLSFWAVHPKGTSYGDAEASPSGRSTQSAWKQCRARHARLNRVTRTVAKWFAQSTSEWPKTLLRGFKGPPIGAPAKAQRSGFGGERRSSGTTELLPRKAKRRMWSLRRRGTPFSPIFLQTKKDGAPGGPTENTMLVKTKNKTIAPPGGPTEKRMPVKTYNPNCKTIQFSPCIPPRFLL